MRDYHGQDEGPCCCRAQATHGLEIQREVKKIAPKYPADKDIHSEENVC
jgi:hypothetical protein